MLESNYTGSLSTQRLVASGEEILLRALSQISYGEIHIVLPDGETLLFKRGTGWSRC